MTDIRHPQDSADVIHWPGAGAGAQDERVEAFLAYWTSMRRAGDVPLRAEIDPRGIEALLSNTFVAEKIAPGLARLRIAGTHLGDLMGMDVRGMPLSALIAPQSRTDLADALVDVFDRPAVARMQLAAPGGFGRPALTGTLVIAPLRSDLGDISRAMGCLVTSGTPGRAPRRFSLSDTQITPLEGACAATVASARCRQTAAPVVRGRAHLRLVKSD